MASLNRVFLIGNLTKPPELRYTPSGTAVADLRLAVNRNYTTQGGEKREETCFLTVVVWESRRRVAANISTRAVPSSSRDGCRRASGKPRTAASEPSSRSWPSASSSWDVPEPPRRRPCRRQPSPSRTTPAPATTTSRSRTQDVPGPTKRGRSEPFPRQLRSPSSAAGSAGGRSASSALTRSISSITRTYAG